ncbi:MAG: diadenylate cyclase CdaA [Eubacteriales bacterium]|nr:diadenylate cyclase CdaA [Eubacteriales bacterium]
MKSFFYSISGFIGVEGPLDILKAVIDVGIVAYVIYKAINLVKETRAMQLIKGIIFIFAAQYLSKWLGFKTIEYILGNSIQLIGFTLVVIFQPELRRALEKLGRSKFRDFITFDEESHEMKVKALIEEIVKACAHFSKSFIGALLVIERKTKINEIINTGVEIDANVSEELLINIFMPNTPLHDGAVIIRDNKIRAAACFLPLTDNPNLSKELGTRHRAALGMTEISDSIAVVISEETGKISFAMNGGLTRNLTPDTLRKALSRNMMDFRTSGRRLALWKAKQK